MWDLVQEQEESESEDMILTHISIDHLIAANIKERIMDLVREGNHFAIEHDVIEDDHFTQTNLTPDTTSDTESVEKSDFRPESVKSFLQEFSNVVTSTWVFRLIDDEMRRQSNRFPGKRSIFLVNLIPNRINLFKRCLFLNQTPNSYDFPFDFIALNLVRGGCQRKDLESLTGESSFSDEAHSMLVKYFRTIGKLVEVVPNTETSDEQQLRVRITDRQQDVNYKRVCSQSEVTQLLRRHNFSQTMSINIHDLPVPETLDASALIFILDNKIEIDDSTCLELDETVTDAAKIKVLIDYLRTSRKIVESEQRAQFSPSTISSPRSLLSSFRSERQ
jgi:hypothetical protein